MEGDLWPLPCASVKERPNMLACANARRMYLLFIAWELATWCSSARAQSWNASGPVLDPCAPLTPVTTVRQARGNAHALCHRT